MRLLLVRHGQTTSNVGHHLDTAEPGADLTDLGRAQAAAIPAALAEESIDLMVVSNLVRTQQTAAPLAASLGLSPWVRPGIREISAGDYEMRNDHEAIEAYVEGVFGWARDLDLRLAGGETGREVVERFDEVVDEVAAHLGEDGTAVLVSHGAIIRVWAGVRTSEIDLRYAADHWVPNTAMLTVTGRPGDWHLESWLEDPLGGRDLGDREHTGPGGETEAAAEAE
ncbi:histidine phosphatase family protein [Mobilicoccus sp.]|uniref:histidine phosphatase family protein n=1 Tax=Mobilicoccus sp. TaxID=2034349 RepID=UPI0028A0E301|nr:histidine phosphatase family protein [Mobilicoccus sp.]